MKFIVFEGLDGSGKSTLMRQLEAYLHQKNIKTISTREPGGTPLGDEIRKLILQTEGEAPVARTELLLYQASRAQHVEKVILPALQNKKWVLCDRFTASSIAFQGGGRELKEADIEWLNLFSTQNIKIDLTVLLDLTEAESRKRRQGREAQLGAAPDRIESEKSEFHQKVRESFLKQSEKNPQDWLVLDAAKSPEVLFSILVQKLSSLGWI